jgi:hypothetical protein
VSKRRTTIEARVIEHPGTGQTVVIKSMEGGGFNIGLPNPDPTKPMRWALAGMFTGGPSGTNLSLVQIDAEEDES